MSIGKRIRDLRKQNNFSQEYLAEKLDVTRQAVSKWEQDLSNPDTGNLIKLSELFSVDVEFLATGKSNILPDIEQPVKGYFKFKKKYVVVIVAVFALCLIIGTIIRIYTLPVDRDAGACDGGYATFIFDKYSDELTQKYLDGTEDNNDIISAEAIRGTQEAEWKDQTIYLQFDIQYENSTQGTIIETVRFIGQRIWFDTYKWSGAIIVG